MIRFKYYILTIISIFFSLNFGLLIGISLGEDYITFQQARVIDSLKEELSSYEKDYQSLKKETEDMKTILNTWETKGEVLKKEITKNINDNKLSVPELIVVGEERFVDNKKEILSEWNIDVTSQFVNSSRLEYYMNKNLDELKSKKLIVSNDTLNDELSEIFEEKGIEYKVVDSIEDNNKILDEFKIINELIGIEELLN